MPSKFNVETGTIEFYNNTCKSSGGADNFVEYRTITNLEATNKQLTLANTPSDVTKVELDIISGTTQEFGVDYNVIGNDLIWNGLGLDVTLLENDKLRITYPI